MLISVCSHDADSAKSQGGEWRKILLDLKKSQLRHGQNEGIYHSYQWHPLRIRLHDYKCFGACADSQLIVSALKACSGVVRMVRLHPRVARESPNSILRRVLRVVAGVDLLCRTWTPDRSISRFGGIELLAY